MFRHAPGACDARVYDVSSRETNRGSILQQELGKLGIRGEEGMRRARRRMVLRR